MIDLEIDYFPIRNIKGQNIAFGGRVIIQMMSQNIKFSRNKLFNKSNELYGLYEAERNKKMDSIIVVEGYMDELHS